MALKLFTLKNNLRVVLESSDAKSVYASVWVGTGSGSEALSEWGVSHFTEHMVFKGTKSRTAQQISEEIDFVGGQSNAFTSRSCTCFYTRTLPENLELAFDILSDIYHNARIEKSDVDLERNVIREEINMLEDCPEDLLQDRLLSEVYPESALGREIAGSLESVEAIDSGVIRDYMRRCYTPDNTVLTVCGSFDMDEAVFLAEKYFEKSFSRFAGNLLLPAAFTPCERVWHKETEQTHLCLMFPSVSDEDDKTNFALAALSNIFGESMSSRVFRSVREERGLCYSIYSYSSQTPVSGIFALYAGLNQSCLDEAEELIHKEIAALLRDGVTDGELEKGRTQLKAAVLMNTESLSARMNCLGQETLFCGAPKSTEDKVKIIASLTKADIENAAHMIFENKYARGIIAD